MIEKQCGQYLVSAVGDLAGQVIKIQMQNVTLQYQYR